MNIKVIGAGCETCGRLYDSVKEAVEETGIEAEIEKVEDLIEIVKLGVMTAPSLMVNGKLAVAGRTAKKDEIIRILKSF
ncbi:MAG: TM0996/MTH895 family glutaredoxin-like protein [Clostridium sp.]|jgi:small redox-active disulfide protein 2|nr:TM0996/MTH895 family glutaredoxin-like protein [Clostridium sp.]